MGGKSSTTTQTVEIPPEVREQYKTLIARGNQITQKPFEAYSQDPTAFVAPLTATQQAGIANINAMQGMAQPSIEQGQGMIMQGIGAGTPLQYQSLDTAAQGRAMGTGLFGESLGTVGAGQATGGQLFGESLGTAAAGTGAAGDIYGQALPAIQQAVNTGAAYGASADPYLRSALGAASPLMSQGAGLTTAGLGAGAGYGALAADYLGRGTQAVDPTAFSGEEIDKYMSPYMKNVVEAQQALQAEEAAAQRSALKGQAIAAGAFGGDRGGIAQANLARQQSLANQATLANLLQGGYGQALGAFQQQQATRLAAEQANRAAQQFGSQQAAALGQQLFGQNLAAGSQLANIGQALFGQNITQGQALAGLGQQLYAQGLGGAQAAAGIGTNIAQMKAQEAALQQQAAQGVFGQAAQAAALQQQAAQGVFNQAAQEAALQQAAAQNLYNMGAQGGASIANLGIAGQAAALQGAQAQLAAGQIEQQTEQAAKSAMYNQFLQQQGFPYQQLGFLGNLSMGIGSQSGGTTTTQQGSFSDRRLKEDVRKVGETFDGQPIYSFKYKGEEKSQLGLIAQEVEKSHPDAVGERDGYLTVDYHDATEDAAKRGHFATGGLVPSRLGGAVTEPGDYAYGGLARQGYEDGGDAEAPMTPSTPATTAPAVNVDPRINQLYQKYMFRDPEAAGGEFWQKQLEGGMPIEDIEAEIANSRERQLVNQKPMTYNAANFATPSAPVMNRYGFYSAPLSSSGSSFTPQAIAARQQQTSYGKGPATSSYTPPARYGAYTPPPAATGKGPSTNAYTGSGYRGYSGSPVATGKGPAAYASGGRVAYAGGGVGASDLKDYIDTMAGSPKGLALAHKSIFGLPTERADITKFSEGMVRGRGSNIPQPGRIPERKDPIKEAAEFGTNVAKLADFGSRAKTKVEEWAKNREAPKPEGSSTEITRTPAAKTSEAPSMQPRTELAGGYKRPDDLLMRTSDTGGDGGDMFAATQSAANDTFGGGLAPSSDFSSFDVASLDVPAFDASGFGDMGSMFFANGGRIPKQMAGGVFGNKEDEGASDPSEGAYATVGPQMDIEFEPKVGSSFARDATQRLLKGGSGGGGGGGGSMLGTLGSIASAGMAAFNIGKAVATFLPMIFSDERLKKNIKPIGRLYDGQTVYRFDMGDETKIGLIAQEVEKKMPDAVGDAGKYKAVDYEMATAKAAKRGHFYGGGVTPSPDISNDPVTEEIEVASVSPSSAMTLSDAEFKDEPAPRVEAAAAPAAEAPATGLSPQAPTGVKPPDERGDEMFGRMTGANQLIRIAPAAGREAAASLGIEFDPKKAQTDRDYAMRLGKEYFNLQLDRFGGDPMLAAAAYHAGPGRVEQAVKKAGDEGGDFLDYLPIGTVQHLSNLSDAARGAHERMLERQRQVEEKAKQGEGPAVVDTPKPAAGLAPRTQTAAVEPGLGAGLGPKRDWELVGSKVLPDMVPKSADFWVPLIAAVGGMLGARAPNLANAIGAGLTAGASAYMKREEFAQEALKNSLGMIEKRFLPIFGEGDLKWLDTMTNRKLTDQQYSSIISQFPGMPRIEGTRLEPAGGLGAAAKAAEPAAPAPAGGLAPAGEGAKPPQPTGVAPPRVEAPAPAAPAPAETPAPAGAAEEKPAREPEKAATVQTNVTALSIPTFASQPEADAWVMENADRLFKGVDPSRDPRTYIQRARQERAREEQFEKRIAALSGDPRPAAKEQIAQLRALQQNAETERGKATDAANRLIEAASSLAMARSKAQMETAEAVERERKLGEVKTEEALRLKRGERDITTSTTLQEVQPELTGPKVFRTQADILREIEKNRGAVPSESGAPGAGNAAPSASAISQQPELVAERLKAVLADEAKAGNNYQMRKLQADRIDSLLKIIEDYQTGALAGRKADAVRYARSLGIDIDESAFDTAKPAEFQKFRKLAVNNILEDSKKLSGPISEKELKFLESGNVDAEMEPEAVAYILATTRGLLNYEDKHFKDYMEWRKANPNNAFPERDFTIQWSEKPENQISRFKEEASVTVPQKLPTDPTGLKHGQRYKLQNGQLRFYDAGGKQFVPEKPQPLE